MKTISYAEMLYLWNKGKRNGKLNLLGYLKRALFSAALEYCRMMGKIAHPKLVKHVISIAEIIKNTIGQKIFKRGMDRASMMIQNARLIKIFPPVREWIKSGAFVFWLGTDVFVRSRSWIWSANQLH